MVASQLSSAYTGLTMPKAFSSAPKLNTIASAARSLRWENRPIPDRRGSTINSLAGKRLSIPMLSCGQACTQSRQKVQSIFPTFSGRNSANSHPRWITTNSGPGARLPRMQSFVPQSSQTSRSRTFTSSGEIVEATKLNCPIGQTNLQNDACLNTPSTTSTVRKYTTISQAVHQGEDHRLNSS